MCATVLITLPVTLLLVYLTKSFLQPGYFLAALEFNSQQHPQNFACCVSLSSSVLVGQEPEPSHATDLALACCFLGKVLGVGCHYLPPPLDIPTFRRQVPPRLHDARDPISEGWNYGREYCPVNLAEMATSTPCRKVRHGTDGFTSPPKEVVLRIFSP